MLRVKIKEDRPSYYYSEWNFTKDKVYTVTTHKGSKGVWTNNNEVHISLQQFNILPSKNTIGGIILCK